MSWERIIKFPETVQIVVREEALLRELPKKIISNVWEASSQQFEVTFVDGFRLRVQTLRHELETIQKS